MEGVVWDVHRAIIQVRFLMTLFLLAALLLFSLLLVFVFAFDFFLVFRRYVALLTLTAKRGSKRRRSGFVDLTKPCALWRTV